MASTAASGLEISPVRRELKVDPGKTATTNVVVANLTKQDLDITLYFREFSVINTDYDYSFQTSPYDWLRIETPQLTLKPGESRTIPYSLTPGAEASPGGYYFTVFASANIDSGGIASTIQAASLLYSTVNGALDYGGRIERIVMPKVLFSPDITYDFTMTDTGNVYYTIYTIATLNSLFDRTSAQTAAHLVLPDKPRRITGDLPAPVLPGIYSATIGYRTDQGVVTTRSQPVVYLPPWSIVVLIGLIIVAVTVTRRLRRRGFRKRT